MIKKTLTQITKSRLNDKPQYDYRSNILKKSLSPDQYRNETKANFLNMINDILVNMLDQIKLIKKFYNPYVNIKDDID